jgi:hypothetical protein
VPNSPKRTSSNLNAVDLNNKDLSYLYGLGCGDAVAVLEDRIDNRHTHAKPTLERYKYEVRRIERTTGLNGRTRMVERLVVVPRDMSPVGNETSTGLLRSFGSAEGRKSELRFDHRRHKPLPVTIVIPTIAPSNDSLSQSSVQKLTIPSEIYLK